MKQKMKIEVRFKDVEFYVREFDFPDNIKSVEGFIDILDASIDENDKMQRLINPK